MKRKATIALGVVLVGAAVAVWITFFARIEGSLSVNHAGNTQQWVTASTEGHFTFRGVRWAEGTILAFTEFDDGRICQTRLDLEPTLSDRLRQALGTFEVSLSAPGHPCWRREPG